jgi:hypothetical protein
VLIPIKSTSVYQSAAAVSWVYRCVGLNKGLNSACAKVSLPKRYQQLPLTLNYTDFHRQNPFANFHRIRISGVWSVSLASIFSKAISIFESVPMSFACKCLLFKVISISEASLLRD